MRLTNLAPRPLPIFYALCAAGVAAGAALALQGVLQGYPYWSDEIYSLTVVQSPLVVAMRRFILPDIHPPLYYGVLAVWTWLFGTGEVAARCLSLLGALGTLGAVWHMGRPVLSRAALALASLWLATHWWWVIFAQETRTYSLAMLGGAWVSLGFARLWNREDAPPPAAIRTFAAVSTLAAFLHYSAMALACSALLLLLWRHRRRPPLWLPPALAMVPCALWSLWHVGHMAGGGWIEALRGGWAGPTALLAALRAVLFPGQFYFQQTPSGPLMVGIWLALAGIYAFFAVEWFRGVRREGGWSGWKASVAGPDWSFLRGQLLLLGLFFAVLALAHQFRAILVFKMLMAVLPAMALCLGSLAAILWRRAPWKLCAGAALLLAASLPASVMGAEHRWARGAAYDRAGLLKIAAGLARSGPGMRVYCRHCGHRMTQLGPHNLSLVAGLPRGTFAPAQLEEEDVRHLVPPFFLFLANPPGPVGDVAARLLEESGLELQVLTPGSRQDLEGRHYLSFYVSAPE